MLNENLQEQIVEDLVPQTNIQEIQKTLYDLFSTHIFTLDGVDMQIEGELPEHFIPKSLMVEKLLQVLNELGAKLNTSKIEGDTHVVNNQEIK